MEKAKGGTRSKKQQSMRQHRLLRDESPMQLDPQTLAVCTSNTGPRVSARPYRMHPNNNAVCDCNNIIEIVDLQV